jgi:hypothetical protein
MTYASLPSQGTIFRPGKTLSLSDKHQKGTCNIFVGSLRLGVVSRLEGLVGVRIIESK